MVYSIHVNDSREFDECVKKLKDEPRVTRDRSTLYVDSDKDWEELRAFLPNAIISKVVAPYLIEQFQREQPATT